MQTKIDALIDPAAGILTITGELSPDGATALIPHETPMEIVASKFVRTPHGSIRFTVNVLFIGVDFERSLLAEKKALKP